MKLNDEHDCLLAIFTLDELAWDFLKALDEPGKPSVLLKVKRWYEGGKDSRIVAMALHNGSLYLAKSEEQTDWRKLPIELVLRLARDVASQISRDTGKAIDIKGLMRGREYDSDLWRNNIPKETPE